MSPMTTRNLGDTAQRKWYNTCMEVKDMVIFPPGVRVMTGVVTPDQPCADVIVYSCRRPSFLFLCLWFACGFGGCGVDLLLSRNVGFVAVVCLAVGLLGVSGLIYGFFGRHVLRLGSETAEYAVGVGIWCKKISFRIDSRIVADVDSYRSEGPVNKGAPVSEVRIRRDGYEESRFGKMMPLRVKETFAALVNRRVKGLPIEPGCGPNAFKLIAHPIALWCLLAVILGLVVYSTSGTQRVAIENGNLIIVISEWWGRRVVKESVPMKDIRYFYFKFAGGRGRSANIFVQGPDGKNLARIDGSCETMSRYQQRLMELVRCGKKGTFDETRVTTRSFRFLAGLLLIGCALLSRTDDDDVATVNGPNPESPDYDLEKIRQLAISRKKHSIRGLTGLGVKRYAVERKRRDK